MKKSAVFAALAIKGSFGMNHPAVSPDSVVDPAPSYRSPLLSRGFSNQVLSTPVQRITTPVNVAPQQPEHPPSSPPRGPLMPRDLNQDFDKKQRIARFGGPKKLFKEEDDN